MDAAMECYQRLLAAQRANAMLPEYAEADREREQKIERQTLTIRTKTRTKAPA
jgi:hypothetical protein